MPITPYAHTGMPLMLPFWTRELDEAGCASAAAKGACMRNVSLASDPVLSDLWL